MKKLRVLLTGPCGRVGRHILPHFEERYDLSTFDQRPLARPQHYISTLQSLEALQAAMLGVDVVLHLAATSDEASFHQELLPNNISGFYNLMEAAHLEGVRRVVFASSVQAVGSKLERSCSPIETDVYAPSSIYGVSKVFGEALGLWYSNYRQLEFVSIRLGWFQPSSELGYDDSLDNIWISPRDGIQLFQKAIEMPFLSYAIVNSTSHTPRELLSLESARQYLGYEPMDDARVSLALNCPVSI